MKQNPFDFTDYIKDMLEMGYCVSITTAVFVPEQLDGYEPEGQEPGRAKAEAEK